MHKKQIKKHLMCMYIKPVVIRPLVYTPLYMVPINR